MSADEPEVRLEIADQIAWIVFDNPRKRNAITPAMCTMLSDAAEQVAADRSVRVVVVRGAGDDAFISGADIGGLGPQTNAVAGELQGIHALHELAVPVLAMINGPCFGGGVAVALDADVRVASARARFAIPAARLGAGYGIDETDRLVGTVGASRAALLLFAGDAIDAPTALRIGLVDEVVPAEGLEARVTTLAHRIAGNAPLSVCAAKQAIRLAVDDSDDTAREPVSALIDACAASADLVEGRAAFLAKRTPHFSGS